jgi:Flp pilus assembly pilin Flp
VTVKADERPFMLDTIWSVWKGDRGQGLTEYALILAIVAVAATGVLIALSGSINGELSTAGSDL